MRPLAFSYSPSTVDEDAVALNQTLVAAGDLALDGALVTDDVAVFDDQQIVTITSAGNLSSRTFTVYGTDKNQIAISEALAGPNANTVSTTLNFKTVTRVAVSNSVGTNVRVGVSGLGGSMPYVLDQYLTPFNVTIGVFEYTGGTYELQYTFEDVFAPDFPTRDDQAWTTHPTMSAKTAVADATLDNPVTAVRFVFTTAADPQGIAGRILQAGAR